MSYLNRIDDWSVTFLGFQIRHVPDDRAAYLHLTGPGLREAVMVEYSPDYGMHLRAWGISAAARHALIGMEFALLCRWQRAGLVDLTLEMWARWARCRYDAAAPTEVLDALSAAEQGAVPHSIAPFDPRWIPRRLLSSPIGRGPLGQILPHLTKLFPADDTGLPQVQAPDHHDDRWAAIRCAPVRDLVAQDRPGDLLFQRLVALPLPAQRLVADWAAARATYVCGEAYVDACSALAGIGVELAYLAAFIMGVEGHDRFATVAATGLTHDEANDLAVAICFNEDDMFGRGSLRADARALGRGYIWRRDPLNVIHEDGACIHYAVPALVAWGARGDAVEVVEP